MSPSHFWEGKRVLVTGGAGFIGSFAVERLLREGAVVKVIDNLENGRLENLRPCKEAIAFMEGDLKDGKVCLEACKGMEIVLNLAAKVGGIDFNKKHPGTMFTSNALISTNMLEAARLCGIERYLCVSSACIYPRYSRYPTPEEDGFKDSPEPTNLGYGWAKRMAEIQAQCYAEEYGMEIAIARPYNAYGPRDHFDGDKAHVIPALIRRILNGEDPLIVWGSGEQSRSFVYVEDVVEGMLLLTEKYPKADPVNLGSDEEIKIKDLARLIVDLSGRTCEIRFDKTKPDGHPRRNSDNTKAKEKIGFKAKVPLREGLKRTIDWYRRER